MRACIIAIVSESDVHAINFNTSGDENHLCGTNLRQSHKISLKAHRYACAHRVGTPIARTEKLPQQLVKVSQIASIIAI